MSYLEDFQKKIDENDYHSFLKLWEEYCFSDEVDPQEYKKILEIAKKSDLAHYFGHHVSKGLNLLEKISSPEAQYAIVQLIFDIQTINTSELAEFAYNFLKQHHADDPYFEKKINIIGLRSREHFPKVISNYELLSHMGKNKFVFHTAGWGTGEILDFSLIREDLTLEFEYVIGKKMLSFDNAMKTLIPLADDHFLSQRFGNPDALEKKAKEDHLHVIHMLLKDLGPKTATEIKEELCDLVIPENEWVKWWQNARSKMKKDTRINVPKETHGRFELLEHGIAHEKVLYQALEAKPSLNEVILLVYNFLRDFSETLKNQEFKQSLEHKIQEVLQEKEITFSQKLQLLFLQEDLKGSVSETINQIIQNLHNPEEIVNSIEIISLKKRLLVRMKQVRSDWQDIYLSLFFIINPNPLRDYLLSELNKEKDLTKLTAKIDDLKNHPLSYPNVFVWYFQKIIGKKAQLPFSDQKGQNQFFEGFLILLDHLFQKPESHELAKKMVHILTHNRYKIVRHVMDNASIEEVKEFLLLFSKCSLLSSQDIKIMYSLAQTVYPELKKDSEVEEKEDIVWTTAKGYNLVKDKVENIVNFQILENAKEIEEARAHGDLRENAEYKAALEKRQRLQNELQGLTENLNKAQILSKEIVRTDCVSVGTMVDCENPKGEIFVFTLLGPWDADPEKKIISFQSKLAESMTNLSIGDSFEFMNEKYVIKKISNYFDGNS